MKLEATFDITFPVLERHGKFGPDDPIDFNKLPVKVNLQDAISDFMTHDDWFITDLVAIKEHRKGEMFSLSSTKSPQQDQENLVISNERMEAHIDKKYRSNLIISRFSDAFPRPEQLTVTVKVRTA
jgi:hypothetical protein